MWLIRSPEISDSWWYWPGKIFSQALMTGSDWSHTYRSTEPSYASTVAFTELRM